MAVSTKSASIYGDKGADSITAGDGNNITQVEIFGDAVGTNDGAGNDTIVLNSGGTGSLLSKATISGGAGADTISLGAGEAIKTSVNANAGNDTITVNVADSFISSTVFGGQGNDSFVLTALLGQHLR